MRDYSDYTRLQATVILANGVGMWAVKEGLQNNSFLEGYTHINLENKKNFRNAEFYFDTGINGRDHISNCNPVILPTLSLAIRKTARFLRITGAEPVAKRPLWIEGAVHRKQRRSDASLTGQGAA